MEILISSSTGRSASYIIYSAVYLFCVKYYGWTVLMRFGVDCRHPFKWMVACHSHCHALIVSSRDGKYRLNIQYILKLWSCFWQNPLMLKTDGSTSVKFSIIFPSAQWGVLTSKSLNCKNKYVLVLLLMVFLQRASYNLKSSIRPDPKRLDTGSALTCVVKRCLMGEPLDKRLVLS